MTWYTDDRHLYWERRRLDQMQAEALAKIKALAKAKEAVTKEPTAPTDVDGER